jgi:hypothetical protein
VREKKRQRTTSATVAGAQEDNDGAKESTPRRTTKAPHRTGADTQAWIGVIRKIASVAQKVAAALTEEAKSQKKEAPKFGSIHVKAAEYLKNDLKNEDGSFKEPSYEQVHAALLSLMAKSDLNSATAGAEVKKEAFVASIPWHQAAAQPLLDLSPPCVGRRLEYKFLIDGIETWCVPSTVLCRVYASIMMRIPI